MSDNDSVQALVGLVTMVVLPVVTIGMAVCAARRGYSFFFWLLLSLVTHPIVTLFLLASLPNRSVEKIRVLEAARLERQLAQAMGGAPAVGAAVPARSLGDASTLR